jgi:two-component system, response regulator
LKNNVIMLVDDNPDDEALTVRALRKNKIINEIVVARDGQQALNYLFGKTRIRAATPRKCPRSYCLI